MRVPSGDAAGWPGRARYGCAGACRTATGPPRSRSPGRRRRCAPAVVGQRDAAAQALAQADLPRDPARLGVEPDQARAAARLRGDVCVGAVAANAAPVAPASFTRRVRRKRTRSTMPRRLPSADDGTRGVRRDGQRRCARLGAERDRRSPSSSARRDVDRAALGHVQALPVGRRAEPPDPARHVALPATIWRWRGRWRPRGVRWRRTRASVGRWRRLARPADGYAGNDLVGRQRRSAWRCRRRSRPAPRVRARRAPRRVWRAGR